MRPDLDEDEEEGARAQPIDPLTDLLFGLVAIIIPAVAILLPMIRVAANAVPAPAGMAVELFRQAELRVDGNPATAVLAGPDGIRTAGPDGRLVPLARILDDPALAGQLERLRARNEPLLVLIEPDGQESAFLFEAVAANRGPSRVLQVRLDHACDFVRDPALLARCRASAGGGAPRP